MKRILSITILLLLFASCEKEEQIYTYTFLQTTHHTAIGEDGVTYYDYDLCPYEMIVSGYTRPQAEFYCSTFTYEDKIIKAIVVGVTFDVTLYEDKVTIITKEESILLNH